VLTALAIQNAKPRDKSYIVTDSTGLHLLVKPSGTRMWRLRYRFGGKQNMLSLGSFPAVSLASARAKRDDARKLIAEGKDPSQQRKEDRLAAETAARNTFRAVAEEVLAGLAETNSAERTMEKNRWLLLDLAAPLAARPVADVTPAEVLVILKTVEKSGRKETAKRLRAAIGRVFRLAIATLRASSDPTYPLRGALSAPVVTPRAAITDECKLGALMVAIDQYDGWPTIRAALQLTALTMTRPGEVRLMQRSEIVWPSAVWRIPAERMKMRRPHEVSLSTQALAVLRDIWPLSEGHDLVLPSIRSLRRPLSENALNSALRRMGYSQDEMCAHGFRAAASTILNERGFNPDVIEAALGHQQSDAVRRAYNRAKYWPERVKLLQAWADLLDQFKNLSGAQTAA
jgi:integrase